MSFATYAEYKDSGDPILGSIPVRWSNLSLKHIASIENSGSFGAEPGSDGVLLPVATTAQIDEVGRFHIDEMPRRVFGAEEIARYGCGCGDILVVKSSGSATNIISGKAGLVDWDTPRFIFSNFLMRVKPDTSRVIPRFAYLLLTSRVTRERIQVMCATTTYPNLDVEEYSSSKVPVPPLDEQAVIVAFLDRETSKIDALVAEQEKLIALLKEKRQTVISHAVTKGLDPNAPMKPSGIEWLGDVPAHWEIIRIGALFREISEDGNDDLPILSVSIHDGVSDKELNEAELDRKVSRSEDRSKYKSVRPGDLAYNMMRAWQGAFGAVTVDGQISPAYIVARPLREIRASFVELILRTPQAIEQMRRYSRGVTDFRLRLYWEEFKNLRVALPIVKEQQIILDEVSAEAAKFDVLADEATRAIELLKERRSALISAAVTGKIDVRGLAAAAGERRLGAGV